MKQPLDLTPKFPMLSAEEEVLVPETPGSAPAQMIGGWRADSQQLAQGKMTFKANAEQILVGDATTPSAGIGIFIGKDGTAYELRFGDPSGDYIHWDGTNLIINGAVLADEFAAGDLQVGIADTERGTTNTNPTKLKEIMVGLGGTIRIFHSMNYEIVGGNDSSTARSRIYRNGVAVGTARATTSGSNTDYSEDISGWTPGDLCQLYAWRDAGGTGDDKANVSTFRIKVAKFSGTTVNTD